MPVSSYRSFIGLAKDNIVTYLTSTIAAGVTTIPVNGTSVVAGSSIIIFDGPRTETLTVTAGGGTSSLTTAATTYAHNQWTYVSAQPTASLGPTDYLPITSLDFQDMYTQLPDKGLRGSNVSEYGFAQGTAHGEINFGGDVFADTVGYLLAMLGSTDFTGGGPPNMHAFAQKNTGDSQQTPYIWYDFNVVNTRAFSGARLEEVLFKLDPKGLITYTAKAKANQSGVVANPTASYSALNPTPVWQMACTLGGTIVPILLSAEFSMKRTVDVIETVYGIQTPYKLWQGPISVTGKLNVVFEDDTQMLNYINISQPSLDLIATAGTGASLTQLQFHCTKTNYTGAKPLQTQKSFVELEIPFTALANTTDATTSGTGYSPAKITIKNTKATGTYL